MADTFPKMLAYIRATDKTTKRHPSSEPPLKHFRSLCSSLARSNTPNAYTRTHANTHAHINTHTEKRCSRLLTANKHDTDGEDLLRVCVGGDIAKAHTGQTTEGEVECGDVLVLNAGTRACVAVIVMFTYLVSQVI